MRADAEESLAHDDKCRDVEDEVWGQIVEIQAGVEHELPDEWKQRKAQTAEEMGEEYHPLMGPRSGDELSLFEKPVRDVTSQISGLPQVFMCPSVTEETIHLPPSPDMTGEG